MLNNILTIRDSIEVIAGASIKTVLAHHDGEVSEFFVYHD